MNNNRPLSPHLSIYKKVLPAIFSILHRFTGIGLSFCSVIIVLWICLIALGENYFYLFKQVSENIIFKFIFIIWTIGLFYHLFNGIRYLYWSFGIGMDLKKIYISGYVVILLTLGSSVLVWFI